MQVSKPGMTESTERATTKRHDGIQIDVCMPCLAWWDLMSAADIAADIAERRDTGLRVEKGGMKGSAYQLGHTCWVASRVCPPASFLAAQTHRQMMRAELDFPMPGVPLMRTAFLEVSFLRPLASDGASPWMCTACLHFRDGTVAKLPGCQQQH